MKPPAFQFYAADFLLGTATMSAEEVGAYIRLLCYQWDTGSIPDDDAAICRLGGCQASALARIRLKFASHSSGLKNDRMEKERQKQRLFREKQAENGAKRWAGNAKPQGLGQPNPCSPSPSPSPSSGNTLKEEPAKPRARNVLFDALCLFENTPVDQVGKAAGRIVAAIRDIKASSPDVTPEEIARRGENYKTLFTVTPTANGLASHWGKCHEPAPKRSFNGSVVAPVRLGQNLT